MDKYLLLSPDLSSPPRVRRALSSELSSDLSRVSRPLFPRPPSAFVATRRSVMPPRTPISYLSLSPHSLSLSHFFSLFLTSLLPSPPLVCPLSTLFLFARSRTTLSLSLSLYRCSYRSASAALFPSCDFTIMVAPFTAGHPFPRDHPPLSLSLATPSRGRGRVPQRGGYLVVLSLRTIREAPRFSLRLSSAL